jgi:hypothetical protein
LACPAPLLAKEMPATRPTTAAKRPPRPAISLDDDASNGESAAPQPSPAQTPNNLPKDATAALVRAVAAYEYGDMNQVVEAARPVAEGLLPASPEEQTQAFRLLGIGLYLTNRPLGAETAFAELLRKDPKARLDPTTTRPELVAFFESLRHQHLVRQRSDRHPYWNFLPPVGQFKNDDNVKGWVILSVGVVSLATSATSLLLLRSWHQQGDLYRHGYDVAMGLRATNWIAVGILSATYVYGVIDGLIGYSRPIDESKPPLSLFLFPGGGGLGFTF